MATRWVLIATNARCTISRLVQLIWACVPSNHMEVKTKDWQQREMLCQLVNEANCWEVEVDIKETEQDGGLYLRIPPFRLHPATGNPCLWDRVWHSHTKKPSSRCNFLTCQSNKNINSAANILLKLACNRAGKAVWPSTHTRPPPLSCPGRVSADLPIYCSAAVTAVKVHRGLALAFSLAG